MAVKTGPTPAQEKLASEKYDELAAFPATQLPERQYQSYASAVARGELAFFLGWGAHFPRNGRPDGPPFWGQVARQLADEAGYDEPVSSVTDFTRLTQYIYETRGEIQFEEYMRDQLGREYPPTLAHWFVAGLPSLLRTKNYASGAPLILTANRHRRQLGECSCRISPDAPLFAPSLAPGLIPDEFQRVL